MGSEPPSFARFSSADKHLVVIRHPRCRPAATCVSRHFAIPPRPRTTFRWAATAQAASFVVGETACAASCASPAPRRPRDGVENRHFFAPRHRRNGPQDRRNCEEKSEFAHGCCVAAVHGIYAWHTTQNPSAICWQISTMAVQWQYNGGNGSVMAVQLTFVFASYWHYLALFGTILALYWHYIGTPGS